MTDAKTTTICWFCENPIEVAHTIVFSHGFVISAGDSRTDVPDLGFLHHECSESVRQLAMQELRRDCVDRAAETSKSVTGYMHAIIDALKSSHHLEDPEVRSELAKLDLLLGRFNDRLKRTQ